MNKKCLQFVFIASVSAGALSFLASCATPVTEKEALAHPVAIEDNTSATMIRCQSSESPKVAALSDKPSDKKVEFSLLFYPGHPFPGEMKPEGFNQLKPKEEQSSSLDLQRELRPAVFKSIHSSLEALADTAGYMVHLRAEDEIEEGHPFPMTLEIRFSHSRKQVFNNFQCCVDGPVALKQGQWSCPSKTL